MNPRLSLVIGIVCIAFSPIFVRMAGAPPLASGFYRIFSGWLILAPYCILKKKYIISRKDLLMALLAGVVFAGDIAVWNFSIMRMSVTVSTLISNLAPLWVGLISFFVLRKRSDWQFWAGTFVAIAGMAVLLGYQNLLHLQLSAGVLFAIAASFLYSNYILLSKSVLQRIDTLTFMFYNVLAASVFMLIACQVAGTPLTGYAPKAWWCFVAMGLICQVGGWLTINHAIMHLPATKTSVALLSQTVMTGLIATVLLNDRLTIKEIIGGIIVLSGIAITFVKNNKSPTQTLPGAEDF